MNEDDPMGFDDADDAGTIAALARTLSVADTRLDTPPPDLWAAIERRVAAGDPAAVVTPISEGRRATIRTRRAAVVGAAAALVAVVVVALVGLFAVLDDDGPTGTRVDEIALSNDGLESTGARSRATATLVRADDGSYAIEIAGSELPALDDGFLELWIIDTSVEGMYSLGPLHGDGRYVLPAHVDPSGFPIVDVSIEPTDGAPAHSGKSILRGTLTI
jgi:anti-sigma-K factor RskA